MGAAGSPSVVLWVLGLPQQCDPMHLAHLGRKRRELLLCGRAGDAPDKDFGPMRRLRHGVVRAAEHTN